MTIKDDEHYEQEDLDLWGVDYQTNKNLPEKVESKLMVESNLLMRFRSQLNKVVWKGLNSAQTKILTVVFSKIGDQLYAYQKKVIDDYIDEQHSMGKRISSKEINEKLKNLEISSTVSAHITYNELRKEIGRLVHSAEDKHQSLVKMPCSSFEYKELIKLNQFNLSTNGANRPMRKNYYDEIQVMMIEDKIAAEIQDGYRVSEVAANLNISRKWVRKTIKERDLIIIKPFKYLITDSETFYLYSTSKRGILRYFAQLKHSDTLMQYINNYELKESWYRWSQVPVGAHTGYKGDYILKVK
ncbi:hypothetical protein IMAU10149_01703 [Lactobacillus helveticus]|uniref:hypothetical protein n=1 Tax=Lactobacillus helveticus TaxID=1587 RepID=UPI001566032C|nr:hypothetical protein [Lactobacillus helveticus]NRO85111.1 hypothetical protein [Lactobacillus helveticus]